MRHLLIALCLLLASAAGAQDTGFVQDVNCTSNGTVSSTPAPGDGCLYLNAQTADFVRLRDALTGGTAWTGDYRCSDPAVLIGCTDDPGNPQRTCTQPQDIINGFSRKAAAMCNLVIVLRNYVRGVEHQEAVGGIVIEEPVIGGGESNP